MALILEVLDARTGAVRTRLRLDALPLTLGRGYDNDLILDDPYADAHHARITRDDGGALVVEDLGSLNGIVVPGSARRLARVRAHAGAEVRVGRTTLRFRDPAEPVPPALADAAEGAWTGARWLTTPWGRVAAPAAAAGVIAVDSWLGSYERSSASDVFASTFGFAVLAVLWAGIWAVAGRVVAHRFHFLGHFAVLSAFAVAAVAYAVVAEWAAFLFPDDPVSTPLAVVAGLAGIAALVAGHLAHASALPRRRRWRAGLVTSGVLLVVGGAAALAEGDRFSDVPEFSGVLKLVGARLVPAITVAEFGRVAAELKHEVDELAAAESAPDGE